MLGLILLAVNPLGLAAQVSSSSVASSKIGIGDRLAYSIAQDPVKGEVIFREVPNHYMVSFPVSRDPNSSVRVEIDVRNKGIEDIKRELKLKLDADYYNNCTVTLTLADQRLDQAIGRVLIFGEIQRGSMQISLNPDRPTTLFQAVIMSGPTQFALLKGVILYRKNPRTGTVEERKFDVEAMQKGDRTSDLKLQDGDELKIPTKGLFGR